jgi:glycosyltransferase involved in cell wall biosynthesis
VSAAFIDSPGGSLHLVVVARLDDAKLASKLMPLVALPEVGQVDLVRRTPLSLAGVRSHCPPRILRGLAPLAELWRVWTLLGLCRRLDPAHSCLVGFYLVPHGVYVDLARRLFGLRAIQVTLSQIDLELALSRPWLLSMLRGAHRVGVRGLNSLRRLVAGGLPAELIFIPPNVYDASPFRPDPAVAKDVDVVFVGGLEKVKRLDVLLAALALVRQRRPELRAAIIGDGERGESLRARAQGLGLADHVRFLGALAPAEIALWLNRSRLFVMTSEREGLPMAMIEALSCGVPVVITDIGDVTTVARHGENAWIVPRHDAAAFSEAVLALLGDEARRLSLAEGALASRARFESEYSLDAACAAWRGALAFGTGAR